MVSPHLRRRLAACLASAALYAPASVAQPAPEVEAQAHFDRGLRLADRGQWSDAIEAFERARALAPLPAVLFNLAEARRRANRTRAALDAYVELGRRVVNDASALEWRLIEGPGSTQGLSLHWTKPATTPLETWSLALPPGVELTSVLEPQSLTLHKGTKTNVWIFQNFDQPLVTPTSASPDWAVEVLVESGSPLP